MIWENLAFKITEKWHNEKILPFMDIKNGNVNELVIFDAGTNNFYFASVKIWKKTRPIYQVGNKIKKEIIVKELWDTLTNYEKDDMIKYIFS